MFPYAVCGYALWTLPENRKQDCRPRLNISIANEVCVPFIIGSQGLSVPDVSRERRCLQTSPEPLMATKTKKTKNQNFRPWEFLGSFSGSGTKIQRLQKHRYSISRGPSPSWNCSPPLLGLSIKNRSPPPPPPAPRTPLPVPEQRKESETSTKISPLDPSKIFGPSRHTAKVA